jgi:predicted 3-demethylubiquinone-9 3-methyltransferase (glyoxalase superfamily)
MNESIDFYSLLFNQTNIISQSPLVSYIELMGTKFMLLNGGNKYKPNSSISYYIYCENALEIERLYNRLIEHGRILMPLGKYDWSEQYAWVEDEYEVNWQLDIDKINSTQKIVPSLLFANDKMKLVK